LSVQRQHPNGWQSALRSGPRKSGPEVSWPPSSLLSILVVLAAFVLPILLRTGRRKETPALSFSVTSEIANRDRHLYPSANITLTNSGDPFRLVTFAKLLSVTPGHQGTASEWRYHPRQINGGTDTSKFCIATIGDPVKYPDGRRNWLVLLRDEGMERKARWEGAGELQFDVEWKFFAEAESVNKCLATVVTRVKLSEDRERLDILKLSETVSL
jgi:hypothetical protein